MIAALATILSLAAVGGPGAAFIKLFDQVEVHSPYACEQTIACRLFSPRRRAPGELYPLIVWLHGYSERGNDGVHHLRWVDQCLIADAGAPDRYRFYLLALQLPRCEEAWYARAFRPQHSHDAPPKDMLFVLKEVVDSVLAENPVDPNRVTLVGVSLGGSACWEFAVRYPDCVAGAAPLSAAGGALESMGRLKNVPIWAFNCTEDHSSPLRNVEARINAVNAAGGAARLTRVPSSSHDSWSAAFHHHGLLDWLLACSRSAVRSSSDHPWFSALARPSFSRGGAAALAAVATAVVALLGLPAAVASATARRRRSRRNPGGS